MRRGVGFLLAVCGLLAVAACAREGPPTYVPPPPAPSYQPADQPSPAVAPTGEELTIARACATDIDRLCAGVPPGEGRIKACMKAHVTELSAPCFDAIMGAIAAEREPE